MSLAARALVAVIRVYKRAVSPLLPASCRFEPSCSAYATEAIARHGALRGAALAARRLLRCRPGVPGGYDPVPLDGNGSGADGAPAERGSD